ncbi:MAG: mechanosensitive ion channel [Magnetococcales bacterium]|nr:mechanosensitive ion channel [Magnetococcales bacterium]
MSRLSLFLLTVLFSFIISSSAWAGTATEHAWQAEKLQTDALRSAITSIEETLKSLADSKESGAEQRQTALKQRLELLDGLIDIIERFPELEMLEQGLDKETRATERSWSQYQTLAELTPPKEPTQTRFDEVRAELENRLKTLEEMQQEVRERHLFMAGLTDTIRATRQHLTDANKLRARLDAKLEQESSDAIKALLSEQLINTGLEQRLAQERLLLLEREEAFEKIYGPLREKRLELAQTRYNRQKEYFDLYQQALNQQQAETVADKERELAAKESAAKAAVRPEERFIIDWEAEIARMQVHMADLRQHKTLVARQTEEQKGHLKEEQDAFRNLEALVKQMGAQGPTAELLKMTFGRIGDRGKALNQILKKKMPARIEVLRSQLAEVGQVQFQMEARWRDGLDGVIGRVPEEERRAFQRRTDALFLKVRLTLGEERRLLLDVLTDLQRLELVVVERQQVLESLERFVLSRVFWIQDAPPLGFTTLTGIMRELFGVQNSLRSWLGSLFEPDSIRQLEEYVKQPISILKGIILFILFPGGLLFMRFLVRRWVRTHVPDQEKHPQGHNRPLLVIASLTGSIFLPAYLLFAAALIDSVTLPVGLDQIIPTLLNHLALFLLLWFIVKGFLTKKGLARRHFGLSPALATTLKRATNATLLCFIGLIMPWNILRADPFLFEALPRLFYTLFEVAMIPVLIYLFRPSSPLVDQAVAGSGTSHHRNAQGRRAFLASNSGLLVGLLIVVMLAVVVLDAAGYRFGAAWLAGNGIKSLTTLLLLAALYRLLVAAVRKGIKPYSPRIHDAKSQTRLSRYQVIGQVRAGLRLVIIPAGIVLVASHWGVNERVLQALREYTLYSVSSADGSLTFVTVADLLYFLVMVLATLLLLKQLPALMEILIFQRVPWDDGKRYAILTMMRYLIALTGLIIAVTALRLDLSTIGWLAAAISVGIGFGLQEIVANFISGIILLVERPIRVGDVVTIGDIFGRITQIKIRATTVRNFDQQEILVPNKDLITREVTNYTLGDAVMRIKILIGVAYGSDVETVTRALTDVADKHPRVLDNPEPQIFFMAHGESTLNFELRVFIPTPDLRNFIRHDMNMLINQRFREEGIEIAFPQRDLHIKSTVTPMVSVTEVMDSPQQQPAPTPEDPATSPV